MLPGTKPTLSCTVVPILLVKYWMVSTHFSIDSPSHSCLLLPCLLVPWTSNSRGNEWKTSTLSCNVPSHYYVTVINVDLFLRTRNDLAKALGLLKAQIDSNVCLNGSKAGTMASSAPLNYPGMWCYFSLQRYVLLFTQAIRIVQIQRLLTRGLLINRPSMSGSCP